MARPPRTIQQGITYHCYSLCHNKQDFLSSSVGKHIFIESVRMCQEKYNFELSATEIVDNHIHLVIKTLENEGTISRIMQYIKARIAEKYNKFMNKSGAFWNGRYKCKIIEEADDPEEYLLSLLCYVAYNPVRKKMCIDPRESFIGFINCYLIEGYQAPVKITLHSFFCKLGNTFDECVRKFMLYEEAYLKRLALNFP